MAFFDDKKKAAEKNFAMDEEQAFKLQMRATRIFGYWVAGQMHLEGKVADDYAESVVEADMEEPGIQDVIRKVKADLAAGDGEFTAHFLETQYNQCMEQARRDMLAEQQAQGEKA
ncbi:MAG: DUF1476 domain-containing protein [Alphaproteobacteria bacterium]|nr:DUF1476 domain-containing protein [Alphaproteobacteria bacterium]